MKKNWIVRLSDYDDVRSIDLRLQKIDWSDLENRRILLTGCNGMLGLCVSSLLIRASSLGLVNFKELILGSRDWESPHLEINNLVNISLISNSEISHVSSEVEYLIHTASPSNVSKINNFEETLNVNSLADFTFKNLRKMTFISSGEVYFGGPTNVEPNVFDFEIKNIREIYPLAKLKSERRFIEQSKIYDFDVDVLRLFHTFGPGVRENDGRSFADFIWSAVKGMDITLYSDGSQVRSFLYVLDASFVILDTLSKSDGARTFNLGSDHPVSILDFAKKVANISGSKIVIKEDFRYLEPSPFDVIVPNLEKTPITQPFPSYSLEFAINKTLKWANSNKSSD